ncbi:branched-chain amino acid aminotransferase [Mycetocola reblochoni]|uniref:Branched-chain-amino-acid aminotransferase n=3 Tax=Mycetocola reblochoni TaxID=331618 RepID=A0A1R4JBC1_9MICO|nr:branched-chain amino acid aminotransferase [Mycetocola reblochoni]RLP70033.1 branched-chain amino acid aminotransferase [Mycetocola reblochoni]SJN29085.1 Branched-chain amino acid aminotransferase [Mycetocola reblochoni REB411]
MSTTDRTAFRRELHPTPVDAAERERILANPGFGERFTDHMVVVDWNVDGGWTDARVVPYGPLSLDPASSVLHYGQEIFEGLKAYRHADGSVWTFRPQKNAERLRRSAHRLALPEVPEHVFLDTLHELIAVDGAWVPSAPETSLYIRPFEIATESFLGVRAAQSVGFFVIASPAGAYFTGGVAPVDIWLATEYSRAGRGGTGAAKCGGNYAASLLPQQEAYANGCQQVLFLDGETHSRIDELGGMNIFFVRSDNTLVTPELTGSILEGVTRDSVIQLAKDRGMSVEEREVTIDEWRDGVADGSITEVFACGTAAVITPIGQLKSPDFTIGAPGQEPGEVTMSIRDELTGIQYGRVADRHGWLYRLDTDTEDAR